MLLLSPNCPIVNSLLEYIEEQINKMKQAGRLSTSVDVTQKLLGSIDEKRTTRTFLVRELKRRGYTASCKESSAYYPSADILIGWG